MKDKNKKQLWILYRHTSPSGKVYIGITCQKPNARWNNGNGYRESTYFHRAIVKYGWDNIKHEILFKNLSETKAKQLEIDLIRHYKNLSISYNITDGGEGISGFKHSKSTKLKMSRLAKIRAATEKGKLLCSNAGKKNKGNHYNRHSGFSKGHYNISDETRKILQEQGKKRRKTVYQYDLNGNFIAMYTSIREAAKINNIRENSISSCISGQNKSAGRFQWTTEYQISLPPYNR